MEETDSEIHLVIAAFCKKIFNCGVTDLFSLNYSPSTRNEMFVGLRIGTRAKHH